MLSALSEESQASSLSEAFSIIGGISSPFPEAEFPTSVLSGETPTCRTFALTSVNFPKKGVS